MSYRKVTPCTAFTRQRQAISGGRETASQFPNLQGPIPADRRSQFRWVMLQAVLFPDSVRFGRPLFPCGFRREHNGTEIIFPGQFHTCKFEDVFHHFSARIAIM